MVDGQHTHNLPNGDAMGGEGKIGRFLEQTRKERGLSLDEVEQATKIRKRYLTGLEREDYGMLPDAVYAQGFLKTYANYLGLDGERLSRQLRSRRKPRRERGINYSPPQSDFEQPLISPCGLAGTEKRKVSVSAVVTLLVALLVLAAVIGTLYFVGRGAQTSGPANPPKAGGNTPPQREQREVSSKQKAPGPKPAAKTGGKTAGKSTGQAAGGESVRKQAGGATTVATQSTPPPGTLRVLVNVEGRPSWLLIQADGSRAYEEVAQPGFSETFEAERQLSITSGDAGAVRVEINGQDAGVLGGPGDVVTKSYTLKSAG